MIIVGAKTMRVVRSTNSEWKGEFGIESKALLCFGRAKEGSYVPQSQS